MAFAHNAGHSTNIHTMARSGIINNTLDDSSEASYDRAVLQLQSIIRNARAHTSLAPWSYSYGWSSVKGSTKWCAGNVVCLHAICMKECLSHRFQRSGVRDYTGTYAAQVAKLTFELKEVLAHCTGRITDSSGRKDVNSRHSHARVILIQ